MKRFPNLARGEKAGEDAIKEVTRTCRLELEAAGLDFYEFGVTLSGEVPARVVGGINGWSFKRAWCYWRAEGPWIPVDLAEKLHAEFGQEVRVAGHCGCPSPREWFGGFGVGNYHVDSAEGLKALADVLRSIEPAGKKSATS